MECNGLREDGRRKPGRPPKLKGLNTKPLFEIVPRAFKGEHMRIYFSPQSTTEYKLIGLKVVGVEAIDIVVYADQGH